MASVSSTQPIRQPGLSNLLTKALRLCGLAAMCVLALIFAAPLLWLADVAFRPKSEIFSVPPKILSGPVTETMKSYSLESFRQAIDRWDVGQAFLNSAFITVSAIVLTILVCSLCAFAFAHMRFPGRDIVFVCLLATMMMPTVTMISPYYRVLRLYGLNNTYQGLIIPYSASVFLLFLLRQYFVKIPSSYIEAALMDGASMFRVWWQIILPLGKPALATLAIYQFRAVWNDFLIPMIVLRNRALHTLPIKLQFMDSQNYNVPFDAIMATSLIAVLIPVVFFFLFQKQFIEGLSGGLKG
ncbi:MAG: carbohydrate ABC transporter permease [Firmicutes bacterium]|nr:carbohydrate ABC transporter permease [Bacillota bacterium]